MNFQAKLEVQTNFDEITKALVSRKDELTKEIDLFSQTQADSLQVSVLLTVYQYKRYNVMITAVTAN